MLSLALALACAVTSPSSLPGDSTPAIVPNDNRQPAGVLAHGVLRVSLEARTGTWYPEGPGGHALTVAAFGEPGGPLLNPGPVIRVPTGTEVAATVRNTLAQPLTLYGFGAARGEADSTVLAPGESRELRFRASAPGTYYYAGKISPGPLVARVNDGTQLNGVIIVDPPGPRRPDRTFVISWWFTLDSTSPTGIGRGTMAINGLSWPHTERLELAQGDSAHWRVINLTALDHPMHLHGFYFSVDAKGDGVRDTLYAPAERRHAVTEIVDPLQTMEISWLASRPGDWIFHCHFAAHVSMLVSLDTWRGQLDSAAEMHHGSDRPHQMFGLVLGIHVARRGAQSAATGPARHLRLLVREKADVYGDHPGYAYVLGGSADDSDGALPVPGPTLVLERGQPVAVTIVNQAREPAAVHWHGIELENSYADGVPGWSGHPGDILRAIPPGDSLTVRFTPPRAGTFMYHSHFNEFQEIPSGLYGPLIVVDRSHPFGSRDRVFIFSDSGPTTNVVAGPFPPVAMNGAAHPAPLELRAGERYRLRFINILGDRSLDVSLVRGDSVVTWRAVAKDGADLPAAEATAQPARLHFDPGEIYDFEFRPAAPGPYVLRFGRPQTRGSAPEFTTVAVVVR